MRNDLGAHLYTSYTRSAAVRLLGVEDSRSACGDQLVIGRDRVAWFAAPPEGSFPAPSRFAWAAARRYVEADDQYGFLPVEVRERGATRQGIELFFAPERWSEFIYLGRASVAGYGLSNAASLGKADLHLHRKLPRDVWLRVGGDEGWSLTIDDEERRGLSEDDVVELATAAVVKGTGELWLSRYEEDSLTLLIEPTRTFVMYLAFPGDSGVSARDPAVTGSLDTAAFTLSNGQVDEFPYEGTVPTDNALSVVEHFVRTGELATSVAWAEG